MRDGFCYDLDVPRGQGLQRRFLLSDTTELLCSHTLSLPRLLERAERARPLQRQNRKRPPAKAAAKSGLRRNLCASLHLLKISGSMS
jgi:hypothetical protein